jgi:hypothetical protein
MFLQGTLALRFRVATPDDLLFFGNAFPELKSDASDINLKCVQQKALFQTYSRRASDKNVGVSKSSAVRIREYRHKDCLTCTAVSRSTLSRPRSSEGD